MREAVKGTDKDDTISGDALRHVEGGAGADRISTGAGTDTIYGGTEDGGDDGEADQLEGGDGEDEYHAGDGDKISDADGKGSIYVNGLLLKGPDEPDGGGCKSDGEDVGQDDGSYKGPDGERYSLSGSTVTVTLESGESITVENFRNGDFGWTFPEEEDTNQAKDEAECRADPIVIDLDRDGLEFRSLTQVLAFFDFDADGFAERTAWVSRDEGILVRDLDGDGRITSRAEIFAAPGAIGFEGLRALDENWDWQLDAQDAAFVSLQVWRDRDEDGATDPGELVSLASLGIVSIDLGDWYPSNPNPARDVTVNAESQVTFADGTTAAAGSAVLRYSPHLTVYRAEAVVLAAREDAMRRRRHRVMARVGDCRGGPSTRRPGCVVPRRKRGCRLRQVSDRQSG